MRIYLTLLFLWATLLAGCAEQSVRSTAASTDKPAELRNIENTILSVSVQIDNEGPFYQGEFRSDGRWYVELPITLDEMHSYFAIWYAQIGDSSIVVLEERGEFYASSSSMSAQTPENANRVFSGRPHFDSDCDGISNLDELNAFSDPLTESGCNSGSGDDVGVTSSLDDSTTLPRSDVRGVDQLYSYKRNSAYVPVLKSCALAEEFDDVCPLSTLPFIGQDRPASRADVLDRLLVTHDWMGERFADFLNDAPDDMIELFGSVTSISIGSTVRPSFYRPDIGAIRLDPAHLWLNVEEKATVSIADDFRSNFGRDLPFLNLFTMLQNGRRATTFHSLLSYEDRDFADMRYQLSELMFHELGHAVDFIPLASLGGLDRQLTPRQATDTLASQHVSTRLYDDLPLNSDTLYRLAQVRFQGEEAAEDLQALTASDVGIEMAGDGASEFYSYASMREDMANLLAISMMKKHFNIDFAIGFSRKPDDVESYRCDELLMGWGTRNRLVDPLVAPRAKWVVDRVFGFRVDNEQLFASGLGASSDMTPGVDWCSNVDGGLVASRTRAAQQISIEQVMSEIGGPRHH